jgi:hypothetical protein
MDDEVVGDAITGDAIMGDAIMGDAITGDAPSAREFAAYLPRLAAPVRIVTFADAQVFVRRWAIRDKDRAVRDLVRQMERANSAENIDRAVKELRRELAARGLLSAPQSPRP